MNFSIINTCSFFRFSDCAICFNYSGCFSTLVASQFIAFKAFKAHFSKVNFYLQLLFTDLSVSYLSFCFFAIFFSVKSARIVFAFFLLFQKKMVRKSCFKFDKDYFDHTCAVFENRHSLVLFLLNIILNIQKKMGRILYM